MTIQPRTPSGSLTRRTGGPAGSSAAGLEHRRGAVRRVPLGDRESSSPAPEGRNRAGTRGSTRTSTPDSILSSRARTTARARDPGLGLMAGWVLILGPVAVMGGDPGRLSFPLMLG